MYINKKKRVIISTAIDPELLEILNKDAMDKGISVSQSVRDLIEKHFKFEEKRD